MDANMKYTVYKTTNLLNGKIYIGKHQTNNPDDDYLGSGDAFLAAKEKYGKENFKKEVLFVFDTEAEMNAKEAELVTEEFVNRNDNYNLCPGGKGGFGFIRNHPDYHEWQKRGAKAGTAKLKEIYGEDYSKNWRTAGRKAFDQKMQSNGGAWFENPRFSGKTHTEETKEKLRKTKNIGSSNSQFGTMWITNGQTNKKIASSDPIPEGWRRGRKNEK